MDYAQLHKTYGTPTPDESRYSPRNVHRLRDESVIGDPDPKHVSTSFVERQNLIMRMSMRRFTRLTNGFSKKLENHGHAVAAHYMHYNFCRASYIGNGGGIADHVWTFEELLALLSR
jgi:hypothetical protein